MKKRKFINYVKFNHHFIDFLVTEGRPPDYFCEGF